jgi:hypothetical protein
MMRRNTPIHSVSVFIPRSLKMFSLRILKSLDPFSVGVNSYRGKHSSFSLAFRVIQHLHPLPVVVVLFSPIYFSLHNAGLVDFVSALSPHKFDDCLPP